jgi:hypothetical protein
MDISPYNYKMMPRDFMIKVRELYQQAKIPKYYHPKIHRGRSHSISAIAEDLVAAFIAFNLCEDFDIYVDQPITVVDQKTTIYPDISIITHNMLLNIIDVKMDLGWKRDQLAAMCSQHSNLVNNIRSKKGKMKDGITKKTSSISIGKDCRYHILIISGCNITKKQLIEQRELSKNYEPDVYCHVLSGGEHPNEYNITDDDLWDKLEIYNEEFDKFFHIISM